MSGSEEIIIKMCSSSFTANNVDTYRESTEHHASDDDDLGQVLVTPLTDGHGNVARVLLTVLTFYATSPPDVFYVCCLNLLTSVSGSQ